MVVQVALPANTNWVVSDSLRQANISSRSFSRKGSTAGF